MSMPSAFAGVAVLLLVLPLTTAHGEYSTLGDLLHWYAHASQTHPSLVRYTELKEPGYEHASLPVATFTNYGSNKGPPGDKPTAILVFGEHARELITCEVGLWFSRVLLGDTSEISTWEEWRTAFAPLGISPDRIQATVEGWVQRILTNLVVKVLPIENVDGRQAWEAGNLCLRKTSKGVDLNRNYPFAFVPEPQHSEMYGGPHPFSEAQSRLIARMAMDGGRVPKAYINVHSGEWAVYSGWDSKAAVGPGLPEDLSDLLVRSGDVCRCQAGPAGAVSNYLAFGTGMDFMYTQLGVPYSLTYEVYGKANPFDGIEPGRIPEGVHNKPLSEYPYVLDPNIAISVPRPDDIFPPPQHHQRNRDVHHQRYHRSARSHATRLRRSAGAWAAEALGAQAGVGAAARGGARRQWGLGGASGQWDDSATGGAGGRRMLSEDATAEGSASFGGESASEAGSQATVGVAAGEAVTAPLGGRSMRHLAAAAAAADAGGQERGAAATLSSEAVAVGVDGAGGAGRALQSDISSYSGPEGPILAMMHQGCFEMFNPPLGPAYRDVVARWVVILLMTLDHVGDPANPKPSPHPLPGTVLAGAGPNGAWNRGAGTFGRRRLLEESSFSSEGEEAEAEAADGESGVGGDVVVKPVSEGRDNGAAAGGHGAGEGNSRRAAGDLYGSASFDRRVQQRQYEVDPVMRQHSMVVFAALCCLGVVFVPWFMCVNKQVSRAIPPSSRRGRGTAVGAAGCAQLPPPAARAFI